MWLCHLLCIILRKWKWLAGWVGASCLRSNNLALKKMVPFVCCLPRACGTHASLCLEVNVIYRDLLKTVILTCSELTHIPPYECIGNFEWVTEKKSHDRKPGTSGGCPVSALGREWGWIELANVGLETGPCTSSLLCTLVFSFSLRLCLPLSNSYLYPPPPQALAIAAPCWVSFVTLYAERGMRNLGAGAASSPSLFCP